jgi:hypothetical protein
MYIYYIDNHQNVISGNSTDALDLYELKIPIVIRHYLKLDTYAVQVGDDKNIPITHTHRRKEGNFVFYHGYIQCVGDPSVYEDWVTILTDVPEDMFSYILDTVTPYVAYWFRVHTDINWPNIHPDRCHLGIKLYLKDKSISNVANCSMYCFGNCKLDKTSTFNALIFAENELEVL